MKERIERMSFILLNIPYFRRKYQMKLISDQKKFFFLHSPLTIFGGYLSQSLFDLIQFRLLISEILCQYFEFVPNFSS